MRNIVIVSGNLGQDPEFNQTEGKKGVTRFSVAENKANLNEKSKNYGSTHTNWFPVRVFDNLALRAREGLRKGDLVTIQGELRTFSVKAEGGVTRHGFEIVAQDIQRATFLPKPTDTKNQSVVADLPDWASFEAEQLS